MQPATAVQADIPTQPTVTPDDILRIGFGFWPAKTLLSAVELGVFTALSDGPADAKTLQQRLGLHPRSASDFLDALVALRMLERHDGRYANTEATSLYLDRNRPTYVGGILEMANARLYPAWGSLSEGLKTGQPQNEARGVDAEEHFDTIYADPERMRQFARAMTGISKGSAHAIARSIPWGDYGTFADIGCAEGAVPVVLAQTHPHLTGIGFDLPPLKSLFEEYIAANGVADRVRFQGGNLFTDPWPRADVLIMGHMLHGWGLEDKKAMLAKAYDALPSGGALLVYEALIDDDRRENAFGLMMSLNMLIETKEGFDYTGQECRDWMHEAGFRKVRVQPLAGVESMVLGTRP